MLYEYAVEPSLLNRWANFRYLTEKFGAAEGRFISRYPKRWKLMVYQSLANCGDAERKRIEVRLQQINDRLLPRSGHYDADRGWLENAETEHTSSPFQAIIAEDNPRNCSFVLDGNTLDDSQPLWENNLPGKVVRKAADMANAIRPLLEWCQVVIFVDPHFGPETPRYRRPFEAFMDVLGSRARRRPLKRVEYHTGDRATETFFQDECRKRLPGLTPFGLQVRLVRWRHQELHDRFILSDVGGLLIGQGLDEDDGAGPTYANFVRLNERDLAAHWSDFAVTPRFAFQGDVTIVGTKSQ